MMVIMKIWMKKVKEEKKRQEKEQETNFEV